MVATFRQPNSFAKRASLVAGGVNAKLRQTLLVAFAHMVRGQRCELRAGLSHPPPPPPPRRLGVLRSVV